MNYSYSGTISGDLLYSVRAHIDAIAATPGDRTIVLACGNNDKSDAGLNAVRREQKRAPRYQTNTLANLYAAATLAASRGVNVLILRGAGVDQFDIEAIADEMRVKFGVKADAINWTSVSNTGDESFDGTHRTNLGMENLAKWSSQNAEFLNVTLPKPFKPASDALHWWRTTASISDKINDPNNGWKNHWFDAEKSKADPVYANKVRIAYAAFNKTQTQATYNELCALY